MNLLVSVSLNSTAKVVKSEVHLNVALNEWSKEDLRSASTLSHSGQKCARWDTDDCFGGAITTHNGAVWSLQLSLVVVGDIILCYLFGAAVVPEFIDRRTNNIQ